MNNLFKNISLVLSVLAISAIAAYAVLAWTEPGSSAPNGNVDVPINTGSTSQGKLGNLGIGIASPSHTLDVNGVIAGQSVAAAGDVLLVGDDTKLVDINAANTMGLYGLQNTTVGSIKLGSGGGTISGSAGNIGIGTTAPAAKLDIQGANAATINNDAPDVLNVVGGHSWGNSYKGGNINLTAGSGDQISAIGGNINLAGGKGNGTTATGGNINIIGGYGLGTSAIGGSVYIAAGGSDGTNKGNVLLGITPAGVIQGNVGIGTTSPVSKVQINSTSGTGGTNYGLNIFANGPATTNYGILSASYGGTTNYGVSTAPNTGTTNYGFWTAPNTGTTNYGVWTAPNTGATNYGVYSAPNTGTTANYAYYGVLSSGANDWGVYIDHETKNYFSGRVGIGTNNPQYNLDVNGSTYVGDSASKLWTGPSGGNNYIESGNNAFNASANLYITGYWTNPVPLMYFAATNAAFMNGKVGIGTVTPAYQLQLTTDSAGKPNGGSWSNSSDNRLKKNIVPISGALEKITQLQGVNFDWINPKEHGNTTGKQGGFIAQDVEKVFPSWVSQIDPTGEDKKLIPQNGQALSLTLPFEYDALMVEAIKELNTKIGLLQSQAKTRTLETDQIQMKDKTTGESYCVSIDNGEWEKTKGTCTN